MKTKIFSDFDLTRLNKSVGEFVADGKLIIDGFSITNYKTSHDSSHVQYVAMLIYHEKEIDNNKL